MNTTKNVSSFQKHYKMQIEKNEFYVQIYGIKFTKDPSVKLTHYTDSKNCQAAENKAKAYAWWRFHNVRHTKHKDEGRHFGCYCMC